MQIIEWEGLRSLRNEAERQAVFYGKRGDDKRAAMWADLGDIASEAIEIKGQITVTCGLPGASPELIGSGEIKHPIPIKGTEQCEQLRNPLLRKVMPRGGL